MQIWPKFFALLHDYILNSSCRDNSRRKLWKMIERKCSRVDSIFVLNTFFQITVNNANDAPTSKRSKYDYAKIHPTLFYTVDTFQRNPCKIKPCITRHRTHSNIEDVFHSFTKPYKMEKNTFRYEKSCKKKFLKHISNYSTTCSNIHISFSFLLKPSKN